MSENHDNHHESPKRVYFGIPIAFALSFWFIVFICLKACDNPKDHCGKDAACKTEDCSKCTPECKAKCEKENDEDLKEDERAGVGLEKANPGGQVDPNAPKSIEGEKSPTEKYDSAQAR